MRQIINSSNENFPGTIVNRCRNHPQGICRMNEKTSLFRAVKAEPTILEVDNPRLFEVYDSFEVHDFTYLPEEGKVHFMVQISLKETWKELELKVQLLDMDTKEVLGEAIDSRKEDDFFIKLEESCIINRKGKNGEFRLGLIAYGKWGQASPEENELALLKEANAGTENFNYKHIWPKKEKETVKLGTIEGRRPDTGSKGDQDHIVIALIRSPEDLSDVDYLCGFGREEKFENRPILCVPGKGEIQFSEDEEPIQEGSEELKNTAVCKLYRKDGGVSVIAGTPDYRCDSDNEIKIKRMSNGYYYEFISWNTAYKDPAQWKKTEFDYHLEMELVTFNRKKGCYHKHNLVVSTLKGDASASNKVCVLQIMYGCVAPWTRIMMADGQQKEIQHIIIGERIAGKAGSSLEVVNIWKGIEDRALHVFKVKGMNELAVTSGHPMLVRGENGEGSWKTADQCAVGEYVLCSDGKISEWKKIEGIEKGAEDIMVYNLELKDSYGVEKRSGQQMITEGIVTGDMNMQNSIL